MLAEVKSAATWFNEPPLAPIFCRDPKERTPLAAPLREGSRNGAPKTALTAGRSVDSTAEQNRGTWNRAVKCRMQPPSTRPRHSGIPIAVLDDEIGKRRWRQLWRRISNEVS